MGPVTRAAASMPSLSSWGTPTFSSDTQVLSALPPCLVWGLCSQGSQRLCCLLLRGADWACCPLLLLCQLRPAPSLPSTRPLWISITIPSRFLQMNLMPTLPHVPLPGADTLSQGYFPRHRLLVFSGKHKSHSYMNWKGLAHEQLRLAPLSPCPSSSAMPGPAAGSPTY